MALAQRNVSNSLIVDKHERGSFHAVNTVARADTHLTQRPVADVREATCRLKHNLDMEMSRVLVPY